MPVYKLTQINVMYERPQLDRKMITEYLHGNLIGRNMQFSLMNELFHVIQTEITISIFVFFFGFVEGFALKALILKPIRL